VPAVNDLSLPFQLDAGAVRGRLIRLGPAFDKMIGNHAYPPSVAALLGQAVTLAAALAGSLKFEGVFSVQAQGSGPVSLLLADVTNAGHIRGYARYDGDYVTQDPAATVDELMGRGHLAFTVDQGAHTERYQGIVELVGPTLAQSAALYFEQSEQLATNLHLACARRPDGTWQAAALMVSRMPVQTSGSPILLASEYEEGWARTNMLLSTLGDAELLDTTIKPAQLLWRLFHQEQLIIHEPRPLIAQCRCSRPRITSTLASFPKAEIEQLADQDGKVIVTCEFCQTAYDFDQGDLQQVYDLQSL
jgi:molecular chaperone Hsp33